MTYQDDISDVKQTLKGLQSDTSTLRTDAATLKENVKHLPSKGFIVTATLATLAVVAALTLFQGNLQRAVGLAPQTNLWNG